MKRIAAAAASILAAFALNALAAEAGEETTPSGIVITTIKAGVGPSPTSASVVKVHYRGTLPDGSEFDSSYKRGQPATFPLNRVIPCWTEGVQAMKVGGKVKLVCPSNLAYGSRGVAGTIPPNATLVFEVELLEILQ
jgi:FKBP-type peptidyl-prolyl cis-trans isomerase FkpA